VARVVGTRQGAHKSLKARVFVSLVVALLIPFGVVLTLLETEWGKDRIRALLVRQANQYLTATLTIGRLGGSFIDGIQLGDVRVSRGGVSLIHIEEIDLSYRLAELFQAGTVIRRVRLLRPRIAAAKLEDGRWDLGSLVKQQPDGHRRGLGRPIEIKSIEIVDGQIALHDPLDFGDAHLPTAFDALNASLSFDYQPTRWRVTFDRLSWTGRAPTLTVVQLTGALGIDPHGLFFDSLRVQTPLSHFRLDGRVIRGDRPSELYLAVQAETFAFQEWSGVVHGLKNIAVVASFDTTLRGPLADLKTDLRLTGTGGSIRGRLTLNTTVPGWHGGGALDITRLDLARWLNRPDRPSDITGHVTFDLALGLGSHFPRGAYTFSGTHAMYMGYQADAVRARGQIASTAVLVTQADALAYGAQVTASSGSIGIDEPFPYRFRGTVAGIDLRRLPPAIPVPRVESRLTFDYDVTGRFSNPVVTGEARFAESSFLGATIQSGTSGSIDTVPSPLRFTGNGGITGVSLQRFGEGLGVGWMRDPRFSGTISGRFHVDGAGSNAATLSLEAGGRITQAEMFHGTLDEADVSLSIESGSLRASYSGRFASLDPSVPFANPAFRASVSGSGTVVAAVRDLLTRGTTAADYDVRGSLALEPSTIRGLAITSAHLDATLEDSALTITRLTVAGPVIEGHGSGLLSRTRSDFLYEVTRADLARLTELTGRRASGIASTSGRVSGPWTELRAIGDASIEQPGIFEIQALTLTGHYDATLPAGDFDRLTAHVEGSGSHVSVARRQVGDFSGTVAFDAGRVDFDLTLTGESRTTRAQGAAVVKIHERTADLLELAVDLSNVSWRLASDGRVARVTWTDGGFTVTPVAFVAGSGDQRIEIAGDWRADGNGALHVQATHVFLDWLAAVFEQQNRYGGVLDIEATIRGTPEKPLVTAAVAVTSGRVERLSYQKLAGRIDYADRRFTIDLRLDQSPGIWMTAAGSVPLALIRHDLPPGAIDVSLKSSDIDLALVEGLTSVVRRVSGRLQIDLRAAGTTSAPRFTGSLAITRAGFQVTASGSTYKNARAAITLEADRINVDALHVEDAGGHTLEVHGSLATEELRVGDLRLDADADQFEIFHNEFGRMNIGAKAQIRGRFDSPRVTGDVTIRSSELQVDQILQRTLFRPYATEPTAVPEASAFPTLDQNLWQRLGMDVTLHVPHTLRLTGDNLQLSPGAPVGIGNINLRVAGDLSIYKDPGDQLYVTGSFDTISGTYAFQGRRFDVSQTSSIVFRGDPDPDLYITVTRVITGVEVRVSLTGTSRQPELHLASTPPLDESDILSLVVFNTSTIQLSAAQQQELFVRAGALAAGFVAAPLLGTIENRLGLEALEISPGDVFSAGPKVTVGEEIAPGLVARFSRQFGIEPYDEAIVEYYLSRILRLRATFSDAQSLNALSPFRRVERAGVDLLFFFGF
jgi:autotransporter translocation and assembly factor TamB